MQMLAADALLDLLLPFWQLVIAVSVIAAVIVSALRVANRGTSRMARAMLVTAAAIICLATVSYLFEAR